MEQPKICRRCNRPMVTDLKDVTPKTCGRRVTTTILPQEEADLILRDVDEECMEARVKWLESLLTRAEGTVKRTQSIEASELADEIHEALRARS